MGENARLHLASIADVPTDAELALHLESRGVVLQFPTLTDADCDVLLARFRAAFPDASAFCSGPGWITILQVVSRERVLERTAEIRAAIADFLATRRALMDRYRAGTLEDEWDANEHGADCLFVHRVTRQHVEAPLWGDAGDLDPFFFAMFVKSTPAHARVAELLTRDFHDAARILDLVEH